MKRTIITAILTFTFTALAVHAVTQTAFSGAGVIESTTGGFKFPDGSVQLSATLPPCTAITYLPYIILSEGVYCFTDNLETSMATGLAIDIQSSNVVINLNGWKLSGLAAGLSTTATGIYAWQRKGITIRNGTIEGFYRGINLNDITPYTTSGNHLIEDTRAYKNTHNGLLVSGMNNIVRRNHVADVGGSLSHTYAIGIQVQGPNARVLNNDITSIFAGDGGDAYGIQIVSGTSAVIKGNRVADVYSPSSNASSIIIGLADGAIVEGNLLSNTEGSVSIGIGIISYVQDILIRGNNITNMGYGIWYVGASTGNYRDNQTSNVTTPFLGGTDAGGND